MTPEEQEARREQWRQKRRRWNKRFGGTTKDPEVQLVQRLLFLTAFATHNSVTVPASRIRELTTAGFIKSWKHLYA